MSYLSGRQHEYFAPSGGKKYQNREWIGKQNVSVWTDRPFGSARVADALKVRCHLLWSKKMYNIDLNQENVCKTKKNNTWDSNLVPHRSTGY
jgi:hypothetical protein